MNQTINAKIMGLLAGVEFINIATCDADGKPNAAPKFLLKVEKNLLYVIDCVMGQSWRNIKVNPLVSIPLMDTKSLVGYRINGIATIIEDEALKKKLLSEFSRKQIELSTQKVIEVIKKEKKHKNLEIEFPREVGMFLVAVKEVVDIGPTGKLTRQR